MCQFHLNQRLENKFDWMWWRWCIHPINNIISSHSYHYRSMFFTTFFLFLLIVNLVSQQKSVAAADVVSSQTNFLHNHNNRANISILKSSLLSTTTKLSPNSIILLEHQRQQRKSSPPILFNDTAQLSSSSASTSSRQRPRRIRRHSSYESYQNQHPHQHYSELFTSSLSSSTSSSSSANSVSSMIIDSDNEDLDLSTWSNYLPYVPYFIQEPYGYVKFSNLYGHILPCQIRFKRMEYSSLSHVSGVMSIDISSSSSPPSSSSSSSSSLPFLNNFNDLLEKIYWEVKDERSLDDEQYVPVMDVPGLREHRPDGSLAFMPFNDLSQVLASNNNGAGVGGNNGKATTAAMMSSISAELHNSYYRCVAVLAGGRGSLISRSIQVGVVYEKNVSSSPSSSSISVRAYDSTVTEGNDAILKCTTNSDLYKVVAWITDDEDIILPLETSLSSSSLSSSSQNNQNIYIPSDTRYYVLPGNGDLLIAAVRSSDLRRQFRCRVAHLLTGERLDSSNWARIKLRDQSSHISYRPRFNLDASLRRTLTIDDDQSSQQNHLSLIAPPIDIYCSFDAQPPPNISWYFLSYFDIDHNRRQGDISNMEPLDMKNSNSIGNNINNHQQQHYIVTSRHLRINQPSLRDVGTYLCVANNSHFQVRHETDLLSKQSLGLNLTIINETPASSSSSSSTIFYPGDTVTLICNLTHQMISAFDLPLPPLINERSNIILKNSGIVVDDDLDGSGRSSSTTTTTMDQVLNSRFMISYYWYHNQVPIVVDQERHRYDVKRGPGGRSSPINNNNNRVVGGSSSKMSGETLLQQRHYETLFGQPNVLRIHELEYSDSGIYQCFVRMNGGPDFEQWLQSTTMIQLRQSPPRLIQTFNEQILMNQQELSLKCLATGIPAPSIIWQRNQMNLTDLTANLINIPSSSSLSSPTNVNSNHLYRYKTSTFQQKSSSLSSSPSMVDGLMGPTKSAGSSKSDQQQSSSLLQTVSYFNITSIRPQDVGQFGCLALNRAGSVIHQARIGIIGPPYVHPIPDRTAVVGESISIQCSYSGYPIEEVFFVKSNRRIPFDERHLMGPMGQLNINQVDKSDEGDYMCVVVGENGQRAQQSFRINTVMPPVLSPFIFSDALEEGTRATAICSVISGDPPITLQWLKDGQPLITAHSRSVDPHIQVLNIKEFISSLIISNITRRHQGVYTCLATTPNTSSNRTAVMRVKAPPKWLIKPSNKVAITNWPITTTNPLMPMVIGDGSSTISSNGHLSQNNLVRFDCAASGNPTPVIRWKFLRWKRNTINGNNNNNRNIDESAQMETVPILSSPQIHVLENGSLLIRSVDKTKFEGVYLCEVSNGVGKPLEARASLTIYQIPQIQVKVIPHGDGSPHKLAKSQPDHHQLQDQVIQLAIRHHSQVSLSCTGTGSVPLFIGWYKNGKEINVYDASSMTSTTSFRVFESAAKNSKTSMDPGKQYGERTTNLMLKHVGRSDTAQYVCMTRNTFGMAHRTVMLHVLESPDAPESLKAIDVGSRTVTLTWSIGYTGNLPLLSQNIEYKKEADKTWHNALMIKSNTNTVTVHGLQPLTPYEFRVSFVNELGASEHSRSITLTTQMEAPTVMPDNVRAVPLSTHAIRLTWSIRIPQQQHQNQQQQSDSNNNNNNNNNNGGMIGTNEIEIIDGFYIGYRALSSNSGSSSSSPSSSMETSNGNQQQQVPSSSSNHQSSSYTYKTITNTPMQPLFSKMMPPPIPPPSSSSSQQQQQQQQLGSRIRNNPNRAKFSNISHMSKLHNQSLMMLDGDGIDSLMIATGPGLGSPGSSSSSSLLFHQYYEHVIDTLQRNTQYQFIVQAFNEKGAGPSSIETTARTFAHDPPRPPNFRIENVSSHEAFLSWDYSNINSLYMMPSSSSSSGSGSPTGLLTSSALIGSSSDQIQDPGPLLVDGFVISYHLAQNYVIDDSNIGEDWQSITISSASTSSFTLRNLRCGSEYVTRIEAFNEMGSGRPSETVRFSTLGSPPIPPDKYSSNFIMSNITFVIINLDLWADGGCPISGYSIKYRTRRSSMHHYRSMQQSSSNSNGWITLSTHLMPEKEKLIIRDLPPGTWHDLIISAQNDAGKREAEYSFATLTETGATVEPLHAFESRMATSFGSGSITLIGAIFDDPMIFIPAICTVIVLVVVISTSVFLYVMRVKQEALQLAGDDTYCSHRSSTRLDEMSLSSYPNSNGTCKKSSLMNAKINGKVHLTYEKNGNGTETEPLYEQTNFAGGNSAMNSKNAAFHKSPHHVQHATLAKSQQLMETIDLSGTSSSQPSSQQQQQLDQSNESYSFEPIFDHRDPIMGQYFKTLQTRAAANAAFQSPSSCNSSHLYQMPEQVKQQQQHQEELVKATLHRNLEIQAAISSSINGEECPIKTASGAAGPATTTTTIMQPGQPGQQQCNLIPKATCNSYMTTFGILRPQQQSTTIVSQQHQQPQQLPQ